MDQFLTLNSQFLCYWWGMKAEVCLSVFRSRGLPHPGQCVTCSVKVSLVLSSSKNTHLYSRPTHQNSPQRSPPRAHGHTKLAICPPPWRTFVSIVTYTTRSVPAYSAHHGKNGPKYVAGAHRGRSIPLVCFPTLREVAQDEGEEEACGGDEPDDRTALLVGLWHHGTCEHGQDGPGGEGLDSGDYILRGAGEKEVA
jgi:hypothetical protein